MLKRLYIATILGLLIFLLKNKVAFVALTAQIVIVLYYSFILQTVLIGFLKIFKSPKNP